MKHRSKKKGHTHGKHHKRKSSATTNTDAEAVQTTSPPSPSASAIPSARPENMESRRSSMCEYCGAPSLMGEGYDDDTFDCADDCERFTNIDINDVTSSDAYQLRSPFLTAFFCQCSAVIGEIQSFVRNARTPNDGQPAFTESVILKIRPKLLDLFIVMWRLGVGRDRYASLSTSSPSPAPPLDSEDESDESTFPRGPTCPFVMVLSVLLPALHKFLQLTQLTKHHWWLGNSASFTMTAATELLTTQLQLHDLLGHVVAEGDRLALVIEDNEERDQDVTRLVPPQPLTPGRSGAYSSSSSSSSLTSSNSRPGSANDRDSGWSRLPQVKKISFEFEEWLAESKFELAELTEAIQENIEITALRLSRFPPLGVATDGTPKAKSPANEFVQSLMTNILVPLAERVVSTPSASRSYLFPRIVDRCICVAIDEYVVENGKWTAEKASYFEKAIELFRSWGTNIDAEFDKQLIKAPPNIARLNLLSMDAFRRLDILLHSWLRHGKDGETYIPRLTFRTNLENLRTTIKRTMTARGNGLNNPSGVSGLTTPSSQ